MKRILLFLALTSQLTFGQEDPTTTTTKKAQYDIDIENLPEDVRKKYVEYYLRSSQLFGQKRIFECLETIRKLHAIYDGNPVTLNLQGACYVEFRDFKKASKSFDKAKKIDPSSKGMLFNIAEIDFVTQKWAQALEKFKEIKPLFDQKNEQRMKDLIGFKIFLCQLKTNQIEQAKATIDQMSYKDDTLLFYYGNAALAYHADQVSEAETWLARGRRVFKNNALINPWQDTLIEFGYIKSFYGGDLEIEENE